MKIVSSGFTQDYFDGASAFNVQGSWQMLPADDNESDRITIRTAVVDLSEPGGTEVEHSFAIKLDSRPAIYLTAGQSLVPARSAYADWLQEFVLGEYGYSGRSN